MDSLSSSGLFSYEPFDFDCLIFPNSEDQFDKTKALPVTDNEISSNSAFLSAEESIQNSFFLNQEFFANLDFLETEPLLLQGRVTTELPLALAQPISNVAIPIIPVSPEPEVSPNHLLLQETVSAELPEALAQPISNAAFPFIPISSEPEVSPNKTSKKRSRTTLERSSTRKKQKTESSSTTEQSDVNPINEKEKKRVASQKFRHRQIEKSQNLQKSIKDSKTRVEQLYQLYQPHRSIELELNLFMEESESELETHSAEIKEFKETLKDLPADQQKQEIRKLKNKLSARNSRTKKKNFIASLESQKEFLENKIKEVFSSAIDSLNQQNLNLFQENKQLKQENALLNQMLSSQRNISSESNAFSQSYWPSDKQY